MTNEEQQKDDIETMKILFNADINELCNQLRFNDAREMEGIRDRIIQSLEQQPSDSNITDSCDGCRYELNSTNGEPCYSCGKYKLTEQQPSENCISREEIKEFINTMLTSNEEMGSIATNEGRWVEEKMYLHGVEILEGISEYINDLPSVTPRRDLAETSQDCVSRKAVRKILVEAKEYGSWDDSSQINRQDALDYVDMLPSVKPQYTDEEIDKAQAVEQAYVDKMVELAVKETKRPKGHWIIIDDCELFMAKCSECGEIVDSRMINKYPYCHCGAEMSGGGEDV